MAQNQYPTVPLTMSDVNQHVRLISTSLNNTISGKLNSTGQITLTNSSTTTVLNDARIGLGVNGNHSNDATIVRRFHLWGRKNGVGTATIHDAFFTNIGVARQAKDALRTIYADALGGDTIRNTLKEMRKQGLSRKSYNELLRKAKEQGLIDPENKITRQDILAPLRSGEDWYGIGP